MNFKIIPILESFSATTKEEYMARLILLERANFGLWGDITSIENKVPPPVTSCHLLGVSPSGP